jgi:hypothetical protein
LKFCLECDHGEKVYRAALDTSARSKKILDKIRPKSSTGVCELERSMWLHLRDIIALQ